MTKGYSIRTVDTVEDRCWASHWMNLGNDGCMVRHVPMVLSTFSAMNVAV